MAFLQLGGIKPIQLEQSTAVFTEPKKLQKWFHLKLTAEPSTATFTVGYGMIIKRYYWFIMGQYIVAIMRNIWVAYGAVFGWFMRGILVACGG